MTKRIIGQVKGKKFCKKLLFILHRQRRMCGEQWPGIIINNHSHLNHTFTIISLILDVITTIIIIIIITRMTGRSHHAMVAVPKALLPSCWGVTIITSFLHHDPQHIDSKIMNSTTKFIVAKCLFLAALAYKSPTIMILMVFNKIPTIFNLLPESSKGGQENIVVL